MTALLGAPSNVSFTAVNSTTALPTMNPGESVTIAVYNQLGTLRSLPVCRYTLYNDLSVQEALTMMPIQAQILPAMAWYHDKTQPPYELCFAGLISPLGHSAFGSNASYTPSVNVRDLPNQELGSFSFSNQYLTAQFSSNNGAIQALSRQSYPPINVNFSQSFGVYGDLGNAYEFGPLSSTPTPVSQLDVVAHVVQGPLVSVVFQIYGNTLMHAVRLYNCSDCDFIESGFVVGPLDQDTTFVSTYETSVNSGNVFYTGAAWWLALGTQMDDGQHDVACCLLQMMVVWK
jgi:hypothetical protein